jgi:hypothetical protein
MQSLSSYSQFEETKVAANICLATKDFKELCPTSNCTNFHEYFLSIRCSNFGQAFGQSFVDCLTSFVVSCFETLAKVHLVTKAKLKNQRTKKAKMSN